MQRQRQQNRQNRAALVTVCALCALCAALTAACGKDGGGNPMSPSAPAPPPIANYAGNWTGQYIITGCTQAGGISLANLCGAAPLGTVLPFTMALTQSGSLISGSFSLGGIVFPATGGTVGTGGNLTLSATSATNGVTIVVSLSMGLNGVSLTGTITQVWTSTGLSGQANLIGTISTAAR